MVDPSGERGGRNNAPRSRPTVSISSGNASNNNNIVQSALSTMAKRSPSSPPLFRTITWILIVLCASFLSFYLGVWTGIQAASGVEGPKAKGGGEVRKLNNLSDEELQRKVEALAKQKVKAELKDLCKQLPSVRRIGFTMAVNYFRPLPSKTSNLVSLFVSTEVPFKLG